ncbi:TetR/AcrR family transcriptional regulator [Kordiimonas aestuarii]|uniref:TetR/AcrR family transcriptional regulator n=1 Tax=Kordiimonas aestuarii TaxID=1005925 RepID=UPI0021D0A7D3|nr:TetR/AcrR family transcriptional regulator [Kordiimonas aestuarii]
MKAQRGRPRTFNPDEAVNSAQAVFWQHGYDATSLNQLAEAVGLHKPSLYAAFGDKKALYLKAYDAYVAQATAPLKKALTAPKLRDALTAFFNAGMDLFMADGGRGCFMLTTAVPIASMMDEVAERIKETRATLANALRVRLKTAQDAGEIKAEQDLWPLVSLLSSTHIAIAVRARSGESRESLQATTKAAVDMVCGS